MNDFSTLIELVRTYSPSGQEAPAVENLIKRMETLGFRRAWADGAGNAVGVMGEGPRQVLLLGHIDTVPGEIPVRVENGILHGRGSVDAKGPLAAFVDAVAAVGAAEGWQFVVVGAVDEERESRGARHLAGQYRPEYAVIGEPSGWERLTLGYKGSARARITVERAAAHTAAADESAPEAAFAIWERLRGWAAAFNEGRPRTFEQVIVRLNGFSSETDGFTSRAALEVQARLPLDLPPEAWYGHLRALAEAAEVAPRGYAIPAWRGERRNPLVRAFLGGIRSAGGKPGFVLKSGTADVNIVAPAWGCPAVVYGPGDSSLDHTPHEHLSLDEYRRAVAVLAAALRRLTAS
jgi:LysW-gamma-L-lysine carboxypeptidase